MAHMENPPFGRGETWYQGATIDSNNLGGKNLEGTVWEFADLDYTQADAKPQRTNKIVKCMVVRNVSAAAILPGYLCSMQSGGTDGKFFAGRVDGLGIATAQDNVYPADEFLPAAGVPINDLFFVVIEGPATVKTDLAAGANNVFNVGTAVVALTAVTSGATTAGRVAPQDITGATTPLAKQIGNRLGWAISAATTANTNAGLLVDIRKW